MVGTPAEEPLRVASRVIVLNFGAKIAEGIRRCHKDEAVTTAYLGSESH